jgi:putative component of membrane protein insertase Oxa1/YidC/SpoIIIJ protein YidD
MKSTKVFFILFFIANTFLFAQNKSDVLMMNNFFHQHNSIDSTKHFALLKRKNPLLMPLTATLYVYQNIISPQLATDCPHIPSCSNFSKQCIAKYGIVKGIALSADRLTRCSPVSMMDLPTYWYDIFTNKVADNPSYYYFRIRK